MRFFLVYLGVSLIMVGLELLILNKLRGNTLFLFYRPYCGVEKKN